MSENNDMKSKVQQVAEEFIDDVKDKLDDVREEVQETREELIARLIATTAEIKPRMRGWAHAITIPFMLISNLLLLILADDMKVRAGIAVFAIGALNLLTASSIYHHTNGWVPAKLTEFLNRVDHTSITILIASTTTPFALLLLDGWKVWVCIASIWGLALAASMVRLLFSKKLPKIVSIVIYVGLGWVPIVFTPDFYAGATDIGPVAGNFAFWLIVAGGVAYTIGAAVFFGVRPKFWHKENVWGFHENFHVSTIVAMACHYAALAVLALNI